MAFVSGDRSSFRAFLIGDHITPTKSAFDPFGMRDRPDSDTGLASRTGCIEAQGSGQEVIPAIMTMYGHTFGILRATYDFCFFLCLIHCFRLLHDCSSRLPP